MALVALLTLVVLVSASVLLHGLNEAARSHVDSDIRTSAALAEARAALIQWAVSNPETPGMLPMPDRNTDAGNPNYDGFTDCVTGTGNVTQAHLLGRFPFRGSHSVASCGNGQAATWPMDVYPRDAAGQPLFYAVSLNLVRNRGDGVGGPDAPINPGLIDLDPPAFPWIRVLDEDGNVLSDRVAAVIIAPGESLAGQSHASNAPDPDQFLDSVSIAGGVYSNADSDGCPEPAGACDGETFIVYPNSDRTSDATDSFNDRLTWVTIDELMRAVERRVVGEVATLLEDYRARYGGYPWLGTFANPKTSTFDAAWGAREGLLPFIDWDASESLTDFATPFAVRWTSTPGSRSVTNLAQVDGTPAPWVVETTVSAPKIIDELNALLDDDGPHSFTVPPPPTGNGACDWTGVAGADQTVSCTATVRHPDLYTITLCYPDDPDGPGPLPYDPCYLDIQNVWVSRTATLTVTYTGTASLDASAGVKARDVAATATSGAIAFLHVEDRIFSDAYEVGHGDLTLDPAAGATFQTAGIYLDLVDYADGAADPLPVDGAGDVQDAFPDWFTANQWQRYLYVAASGAYTGRALAGWTGEGSGTDTLSSPGQDFAALGVAAGDLVAKLDASLDVASAGVVSGTVGSSTITVDLPGTDTWSPGDRYVVWPGAVTGLAGGGSTPLVLEDLGQDFAAAGVSAGDRVYDLTDGSSGEVVAVGTTDVTVEALAGGTDNQFDPGDRYRVTRCTRPPAAPGTAAAAIDCLVVNVETAAGGGLPRERRNVRAVVLGAGGALATQDRDAASACPNGVPFLCDYYELDNTDKVTTGEDIVFLRNGISAAPAFNDQTRVASPPPP